MAREEPDIFGGEVGLVLILRVSKPGTGDPLGIVPPGLVVQIENGYPSLLEEQFLRRPVGLHGAMKIQVVAGQVGKYSRRKKETVHPVQAEGVGRYLHNHMGASRIGHLPQQLLNFPGFRGGPVRRKNLFSDQVLIGADKPHPGARRLLQHRLEKIGRGGFSIGAGDANYGKLLRRMANPVGRVRRQGGGRLSPARVPVLPGHAGRGPQPRLCPEPPE